MSGLHGAHNAHPSVASSAVARDAAVAAERLREALGRHGLLQGVLTFTPVRGELSREGRPVVTLGPISADTALAVADLLDQIRPGGV